MTTPQPAERSKFRVHHLAQAKAQARALTMLTAYDAITARIFDAAGVDMLLVGDSMGDNVLALPNTIPVTLDEMIPLARAVARSAPNALVVADLPFGSYEDSPAHAFASAVRMFKEAGAHAVKIEGGQRVSAQVELLTNSGIPVFGHLGFTPQSENLFGGKRVQGRGDEAAAKLLEDAHSLQRAGAVALVLEMVPATLAKRVTAELEIPTIGIGAGPDCDGQVLVWTDMAGMNDWSPRFAQRFGEVGQALHDAASQYVAAVRGGDFPTVQQSFER